MRIVKVERHRNGISGAPFNVVLFDFEGASGDQRNMVGIVFDDEGVVAVLDRDLLAAGEMAFGANSWRGDNFEPRLRRAIKQWEEQRERSSEDD